MQFVKSFYVLQAEGKNAEKQQALLSFNLMPGDAMDRSATRRFAQQSRSASSPFAARQSGFTLVEMAVVLVIIGVILGAVMIGRDAQRNAEYLRIRQTFVNQWAVAYNSYVQRTGVPPGDDVGAPRLMVTGAAILNPPGGDLSAFVGPGALCGANASPGLAAGAPAQNSTMRNVFLTVGIELPSGRGLNMEDRYVYLDTNGIPQELQVCFQWNAPGTLSGAGNVMVISGLTPDLAQSLDAAIDGQGAANRGSFRQANVAMVAGTGVGAVGALWTGNNTQNFAGAAGNRDQQVRVVTAHYKMNQ